jgi:hypothetical protein
MAAGMLLLDVLEETMKRLALSLILLSAAAFAADEIHLGRHNFVNLSVESPGVQINIGYPGKISGVFGLEIVPSIYWVDPKDIERLADELLVTQGIPWGGTAWTPLERVPAAGGRALNYKLSRLDTYVTWVRISTRSGEPLDALFKRVIHPHGIETGPVTIILRSLGCAAQLAESGGRS